MPDSPEDEQPLVEIVQLHNFNCSEKLVQFVAAPLIVFSTIAGICRDSVLQNLILEKVCTQHYHYNESICNSSANNATVENELQQYGVIINMAMSLTQLLPGAILSLFMGPLVDKHGAKYVLALPVLGNMVGTLIYFLLIEAWPSFPVEMILLPSLPIGLSGAKVLYTVCIFKYISSLSDQKTRSINFVIADSLMIGSLPLGSYIARIIYEHYKYVGTFSLSLGLYIISVLYILILPHDKPSHDPNQTNHSIFSFKNIKSSIEAVTQKRAFHQTQRLICLIGILVVFSMTFSGVDMNIQYFFIIEAYQWTYIQYMNYLTWSIAVLTIGSFLEICLLSYYIRLPDDIIILLGVIIRSITLLLFGLGTSLWQVYISGALSFFVGALFPCIRSQISKISGKKDVGKVFAIMASLEAFVPLIGVPIFTLIYRQTIQIEPGIVYFLGSGIMLICLLLNIIHIKLRRQEEQLLE